MYKIIIFNVFLELEMPLQMSLCNMEDVGFPTSSEALHKLFQQMVDSMKKLETKIYEMHGSKFNLGSSSAVARVSFTYILNIFYYNMVDRF